MAEEREDSASAAGRSAGGSWSPQELQVLAAVEPALAGARELKRWWDETDAAGAYDERFDLATTGGGPAAGFGFFDQTPVAGSDLPVMGHVLEQLYDRPKGLAAADAARGLAAADAARAAAWIDAQVREFVLRYFLRVSAFAAPEAFAGKNGQEPPPPYLRPFSWYPETEPGRQGFGFEQLFYKLKSSDLPRRFSGEDRHAIVDLRQLGSTYEWVVLKVEVFDFNLVLAPFGQSYPHGTLPATEPSYLVLSEDFIQDLEAPADRDQSGGRLGRYGCGWAFLPAAEESFLAHGLGRFEAAFQVIRFDVGAAGEVTSRLAFVASRPKTAVQLSVDPVDWGLRMADRFSFGTASPVIEPMQKMWSQMPGAGGVDLVQTFITAANMVTSGGAARSLGVSKKQLHKNFLVAQFAQQVHLIAGSLAAWRRVPDWLDRDQLPGWAVSGKGV